MHSLKTLALTLCCMLLFTPTASSYDLLDKTSLSVYGIGHISADLNDDGDNTDATIASNSSRFGFRGSMELSQELSIIAQLETGVDLTFRGINDGNGGTNSSGRLFTMFKDSFAGLHHKRFGELIAGRVGALNQYVYDYNLFADQVGDLGNLWGAHGLFDRIDIALQYSSPKFSGFNIKGLFAPESGEGDDDVYVIKGNYGNRGFMAGIAYLNQGQAFMGVGDHQAFAATTSYTFGNGKYSVGGGYQRELNASGINSNDFNSITLAGAAKLGPGQLKAQFGWMGDGQTANTGAITWVVGYDYSFRNDTTIYFAYSGVSNDNAATVSANNYGHGQAATIAPGNDPWSVSLGLVYNFDVNLWP
jgi:predicted porin